MLTAGDVRIDERAHRAYRGELELALTLREFALLTLLVRYPDRVFTKAALVSMLFASPVTPNAVVVHMGNLRRKLEEGGPRLIQTVWGLGYVLRTEPAGQLSLPFFSDGDLTGLASSAS